MDAAAWDSRALGASVAKLEEQLAKLERLLLPRAGRNSNRAWAGGGGKNGAEREAGETAASRPGRRQQDLATCPFNTAHRVPRKSYDAHYRRCELAHHGVSARGERALPSSMPFYRRAPRVISILTEEYVGASNGLLPKSGNLSADKDDGSAGSSLVGWDGLEPDVGLLRDSDSAAANIGKIASFTLVPPPYQYIDVRPLDAMKIRGWLINTLPTCRRAPGAAEKRAGAEVAAADAVYRGLVANGPVHVDKVAADVRALLGGDARDFVRRLWKFLLVEKMSRWEPPPPPAPGAEMASCTFPTNASHGFQAPPRQPEEMGLRLVEDHKGDNLVFTVCSATPAPRVGMSRSVAERRRIADLEQEMCEAVRRKFNIPPAAEDNAAIDELMRMAEECKAERAESEKQQDEQRLSEQRDYKRRRKSYRAKNVRITQRTPTQVHRDLVNTYMDDLTLMNELASKMPR